MNCGAGYPEPKQVFFGISQALLVNDSGTGPPKPTGTLNLAFQSNSGFLDQKFGESERLYPSTQLFRRPIYSILGKEVRICDLS